MTEHNEMTAMSLSLGGKFSKPAETTAYVTCHRSEVQPLTLAEFVTVAREVAQEGGRSMKAIRRFNAYVDVDMVLRARTGAPEPTSAAELRALMRCTTTRNSYDRSIQEIWLDYERAGGALKEYRELSGTNER